MTEKHPLAVWLIGNKEKSQKQLAEEGGCSESHLSLVLRGKRGVSMRVAKGLSDATNGEVRIEDFLQEVVETSQ